MILILLKREFSIILKNINSYLLYLFIFPSVLYLFLVTPFYDILRSASGMHYIYHAFPAILFLSSSFLSFCIPLFIIKRDVHESNYFTYLQTLNINIYIYKIYLTLVSLCMSYIQFFISLFILTQLASSIIITFNQIIMFSIAIFPIILLMSLIGVLFSNFTESNHSMIMTLIFMFLFLSFGVGSFIPVEYFSETFIHAIKKYNLFYYLNDMFIRILQSENISIGIPLTTIFISIVLFFINYYITIKRLGKY